MRKSITFALMIKKNEFNDYRLHLYDRIMALAMKRFLSDGIKATKMDAIANDLGISKRTLYEIFGNKESLLLAIVKKQRGEYTQYMQELIHKGYDPMRIVLEFFMIQLKMLQSIKPSIYDEIQNYKMLQDFFEERKKSRKDAALNFFANGVREGYFREDVDYSLILDLGEAHSQFIRNNALCHNRRIIDVFKNTFMVTVRGISTLKGLEVVDSYMETINQI